LSVVAIVCVAPGTIPPVDGGVIGNDPSWTSNAGEPIAFGVAIFSAPLTVRAGEISFGTISGLRSLSRLSCEKGETGGCTGASGRGGISVLGTTWGGGLEAGG